MYQKPDFVKVSLKVSDVFASYLATGCPEDELINYTNPCEVGSPNYSRDTYTAMGLAHQCYSTYNP